MEDAWHLQPLTYMNIYSRSSPGGHLIYIVDLDTALILKGFTVSVANAGS